jgi:hypothetical protein
LSNRPALRRQLILVALLGGVAYLWWQSRLPGHYSEWTKDLPVSGDVVTDHLDWTSARSWSFASTGDSSLRVYLLQDSLSHFRVDLCHHDSLLTRQRLDLDAAGNLCAYGWQADPRYLRITPAGDSAFLQSGPDAASSWIPWSQDALIYDAAVALCDLWARFESGRPITLVRINPLTEVVVQLPGTIQARAYGRAVVASGKELLRATLDSLAFECRTVSDASHQWTRTSLSQVKPPS